MSNKLHRHIRSALQLFVVGDVYHYDFNLLRDDLLSYRPLNDQDTYLIDACEVVKDLTKVSQNTDKSTFMQVVDTLLMRDE